MKNRTPEQQQRLNDFLESPENSDAEKAVVKWQFELYGSFYMALFDLMTRADHEHLERLEIAFPVEVAGFKAWRHESNELANKIDEEIGL